MRIGKDWWEYSLVLSLEVSTEALQKQNLEPSFDLTIPFHREDLQESKCASPEILAHLCLHCKHDSQDTAVAVKTTTSRKNMVNTHNGIVPVTKKHDFPSCVELMEMELTL